MFALDKSLSVLQKQVPDFPDKLVVLGSGWNKVLDNASIIMEIGYDDLFGVRATVPGHEGKLIIATVNRKKIAFMSGRFHMYEGFSAHESTAPVRVFAAAGMKELILTAACGALNETYRVGDVVILKDMITLLMSLDSPLIGPSFVDTSCVFDKDLRGRAVTFCRNHAVPYREGSYIYYHGPNFETPADKKAMKILGADVCGMSMVAETLVARALAIKVLGLAFVTNLAFVKHDHVEVLKEAQRGSGRMSALLNGLIGT